MHVKTLELEHGEVYKISPHIAYPFNYGKFYFYFFVMVSTKTQIEQRLHNTIISWNIFTCIEIYGPLSLLAKNPLILNLHNIFELLLQKGQATCGKKIERVSGINFICIRYGSMIHAVDVFS